MKISETFVCVLLNILIIDMPICFNSLDCFNIFYVFHYRNYTNSSFSDQWFRTSKTKNFCFLTSANW